MTEGERTVGLKPPHPGYFGVKCSSNSRTATVRNIPESTMCDWFKVKLGFKFIWVKSGVTVVWGGISFLLHIAASRRSRNLHLQLPAPHFSSPQVALGYRSVDKQSLKSTRESSAHHISSSTWVVTTSVPLTVCRGRPVSMPASLTVRSGLSSGLHVHLPCWSGCSSRHVWPRWQCCRASCSLHDCLPHGAGEDLPAMSSVHPPFWASLQVNNSS